MKRKIIVIFLAILIAVCTLGVFGCDGKDGVDGFDGKDGMSAYEVWLEQGNDGSKQDFLDWLKADKNEIVSDTINAVNPLYGKTIHFEGDSICEGKVNGGGYAKIIGERNGMTVYNTAKSGGTIASGTTYNGYARHYICLSIDNMNKDADYYIFQGGINDAAGSVGVELGELTSKYDATLDTTTMIGAMEYACKSLVTNFPGKKYGFIFVHGVYPLTGHKWNDSWRPEMKKALNKWGIPFIDLQEQIPPFQLIPSLREQYTVNGDGWHPTAEAYEKFYCDKIEAWLKTL